MNEAHKESIRSEVVDFIASNVLPSRSLHFFGMPGLGWCTEYKLWARWPVTRWNDVRFIGAEWDGDVFLLSNRKMPARTPWSRSRRSYLRAGSQFLYYESDMAMFVNARVSTLLTLEERLVGSVLYRNWFDEYDAFWLDFTSNFCQEVITSCRALGQKATSDRTVPFVITITMGRELPENHRYLLALGRRMDSPLDIRAEALRHIIEVNSARAVSIVRTRQYTAWGAKQSMGMFFGIVHPNKGVCGHVNSSVGYSRSEDI